MVSKTLRFTEKQIAFFKEHGDLTFSEHVRRAVDKYVNELRLSRLNVSDSLSKKGGE